MNFEILPNEYWMYQNEPFYVVRFLENGNRYLFGKDVHESAGIEKLRELKGYLRPSEEQIKRVENEYTRIDSHSN
jgi:hypothetical protein